MSVVEIDKALGLEIIELPAFENESWSVACCADMVFGFRYKEGKVILMLRCPKCIPNKCHHIIIEV